jgi:hypothetical protein
MCSRLAHPILGLWQDFVCFCGLYLYHFGTVVILFIFLKHRFNAVATQASSVSLHTFTRSDPRAK